MGSSYMPRTMTATFGRTALTATSTIPLDPFDLQNRDQTMTTMALAPSFPPFKFEPRRTRIDWRLLHGVDINTIVRDVDLDTLEKIVHVVAYGDIEAEDTRHMSELNFLKVFRLSQLIVEYLLYVQDCLQGTNNWIQQDRTTMEKYVAAARIRLRELEAALKMSKRELRRARKTIKTYEMMVAMGKLGAENEEKKKADPPPPPQPQVVKVDPSPATAAMEAVLRKELLLLSERLTKAQLESQQLRAERDELYQQVKELDVAVRGRGASPKAGFDPSAAELRTAKEQLGKANSDLRAIRAEKDDVQAQLDRALAHKKVLQEEKDTLLHELTAQSMRAAAAPAVADAGGSSAGAGSALSAMLLDAEARNKSLESKYEESRQETTALRQEIGALQKQLMKAMKDAAGSSAAKPGSVSGPSLEDVQRALQAAEAARNELLGRVGELERELTNSRRKHNEDVRDLQDELVTYQEQAAELRRELVQYKSSAVTASPVTMAVKPKAGFVPFTEDSPQRQAANAQEAQAKQAQYEADITRLKSDKMQLELQAADLSQRNSQLQETLRQREEQVSQLMALVRELQTQLQAAQQLQARQMDAAAMGRVKQQVQEFEAIAERDAVMSATNAAAIEATRLAGAVASTAAVGPPAAGDKNASFKFKPPTLAALQGEASRQSSEAGPATPILPGKSGGKAAAVVAAAAAAIASAGAADGAAAAGAAVPVVAPLAYQSVRPGPAEANALRAKLLSRVAGYTPEQMGLLIEDELRAATDSPYEYQDDDEETFRALMPHEVPGAHGVLTVKAHSQQDMPYAQQRHGPALLSALDDAVASFGIDPSSGMMSDREYAAAMLELEDRRKAQLSALPEELQDEAVLLRNFLLTHLELCKRQAIDQRGKRAVMGIMDPADTYAELAAAAAAAAAGNGIRAATVAPAPFAQYPGSSNAPAALQQLPSTISTTSDVGQVLREYTLSRRDPSNTGAGSGHSLSSTLNSQLPVPAYVGQKVYATAASAPQSQLRDEPYSYGVHGNAPTSHPPAAGPSGPPSRTGSDLARGMAGAAAAAAAAAALGLAVAGATSSIPASSLPSSCPNSGVPSSSDSEASSPMNRSITKAQAPAAASAVPSSLNHSLNSTNHSRASAAIRPGGVSAAGSAGSAAQPGGVVTLNQSLPRASGGPSTLNASLQRPGGRAPVVTSVTGGAISPLNMSVRSQGKASLRDYNTNDFDDDDDSDLQDSLPDKQSDEYQVGADEEDDVEYDEALSDLPDPAFGRSSAQQQLTRPGTRRASDRTSAPSRLARVTSADAVGQPGQSQQMRTSGRGWLDTQVEESGEYDTGHSSSHGQPDDDERQPQEQLQRDVDEESIHSFHPNDTAASSRGPANKAAAAAAKAPGAWSSPSTTIRSQRGTAAGGGGGGGGGWNETIRTIGSGAGDEVQAMHEGSDDDGSFDSSMRAGPTLRQSQFAPLPFSGDALRQGRGNNSIRDDVSEVEFM